MPRTIESRLVERSLRDHESGCLRWQGARNHKGYGQISINGRRTGVHRIAYTAWVGPIPDGYEIDHVFARGCVYRDCIEPAHLQAVTRQENMARIPADHRAESKITHCPSGHLYDEENTRWTTRNGYQTRDCRTCCRQRINSEKLCGCGASYRAKNGTRHRATMAHKAWERASK